MHLQSIFHYGAYDVENMHLRLSKTLSKNCPHAEIRQTFLLVNPGISRSRFKTIKFKSLSNLWIIQLVSMYINSTFYMFSIITAIWQTIQLDNVSLDLKRKLKQISNNWLSHVSDTPFSAHFSSHQLWRILKLKVQKFFKSHFAILW